MITVRCSCCRGTGKVELTGHYADTWHLLRAAGESHGAALAALAGCTGPAMNMRLAALERMGLAVSRRRGVLRLYTVKTNEGEA